MHNLDSETITSSGYWLDRKEKHIPESTANISRSIASALTRGDTKN